MARIKINRAFARTGVAIIFLAMAASRGGAATEDQGAQLQETAANSTLSGSYLAAEQAIKVNDDAAAVAFFERSLILDPENQELKQKLFLALAANGRIDDAVEILRDGSSIQDKVSFTRLVVAVNAMKGKSWTRVEEILKDRAGGDLDRLVEDLLVNWALFGSGDTEGAIEATLKISGPEWVGIIRNYHAGLMQAATGHDKEAAELFSAATKNQTVAAVLSETFLRAVEALIRAEARMGELENARKTLAMGIDLLPTHPPFLQIQQELNTGKTLMPLVTSAQEGASEIFYNVGAAVSRQGGAPFAQSYLQLADYLRPKADFVAMTLAGLFEDQKNHVRANLYYAKISANSPYYRRSQVEYALNLNDLKEIEQSKTVLRDLIKSDPDDLLAYTTLGGILSQHEEYQEAAKIYDAAVEKVTLPDRQHWTLFYRRGIAHERIKQWDKAERDFKKSLELSPDQPNVLNYLGYSWIDMGMNLDEGLNLIRKAVDLRPNSGFIVDSLGWAYYRLGRYEEAVSELEKAVDLMPEDPVINDHLGDAYWKTGRKLEATFQWNHSLIFKPEPEDEAKIQIKLKKGLEEAEKSQTALQ